jgi:hypothetical protein
MPGLKKHHRTDRPALAMHATHLRHRLSMTHISARRSRCALLAGVATVSAVLACADDGAVLPTDPSVTARGTADSGRGAAPPPSTPPSTPPGDSVATPAPAHVLTGIVVVPQAVAAGSDSVTLRPIAGAPVTIFAYTPADSNTGAPASLREVATTRSDAGGAFTTPRLADGSYLVRATAPAGTSWRPGDSRATLAGGRAYPSQLLVRLVE